MSLNIDPFIVNYVRVEIICVQMTISILNMCTEVNILEILTEV